MQVRYFAVTCKHGHHGSKKYQPITFAIAACDAMEACDKAREMPGVKHSAMVVACREISTTSYNELRNTSAYKRSLLI